MQPFFSVVITSYNRSAQLARAIDAVVAQTYTNFELLVVDDCSTDNTIKRLELFKEQPFHFFSTERNTGGPAVPRNIGIVQARGEWICFCDSDDVYATDHLEKLHAFIETSEPGNAIISTNAFIMRNGEKTNATYFPKTGVAGRVVSFMNNWRSSRLILSSMCVRNERIVPFRTEKEYQSIEDYLFLLENILNGKRHFYLDKPGIFYCDDSGDSIRGVHHAGQRLYHYKFQFLHEHKLWRKKNGLPLFVIAVFDFLKYGLKKIALHGG